MSNSLAPGDKSGSPGPTRQQLDELDALLQRMLDLPVSQADEPPPETEPEEDLSPPPGYPPTSDYVGASPGLAAPPGWEPPSLAPRVVNAPPDDPALGVEPPVPGGRHDLEEDAPVDPTEELARIRAQMQQQAGLPPTAHIPNPPAAGQGEWVPRQAWQPSAQTWKPLAERWEQARDQEPAAPVAAPPTFSPPRFSPSGPRVTLQTAEAEEAVIPPPPSAARPEPPAPAPEPPAPTAPTPPAPDPWPLRALAAFNGGFDVVLLAWCPKGKLLRGPAGRSVLGAVGVVCLLAAAMLAAADWCGWTW